MSKIAVSHPEKKASTGTDPLSRFSAMDGCTSVATPRRTWQQVTSFLAAQLSKRLRHSSRWVRY